MTNADRIRQMSDEELAANHRAHSAKLRIIEKIREGK